VHCVLYFINPTGHALKPLDIEVLQQLSALTNVIPVIAKSDTLTLDERAAFKKRIKDELAYHSIPVFPSNIRALNAEESATDTEERELNDSVLVRVF
jgi:septin 3/9/12